MRNNFPKRTSGAQFHTLSKLYDVPVCFEHPNPICVFVCLRSPKGSCYSTLDGLFLFNRADNIQNALHGSLNVDTTKCVGMFFGTANPPLIVS